MFHVVYWYLLQVTLVCLMYSKLLFLLYGILVCLMYVVVHLAANVNFITTPIL